MHFMMRKRGVFMPDALPAMSVSLGDQIPMGEGTDMDCVTDFKVTIKKMMLLSIPPRWLCGAKSHIIIREKLPTSKTVEPPKNGGRKATVTIIKRLTDMDTSV